MKSPLEKKEIKNESLCRKELHKVKTKLNLHRSSKVGGMLIGAFTGFFFPVIDCLAGPSVDPVFFAGDPTVEDVIRICNLPPTKKNDGQPYVRSINNPTSQNGDDYTLPVDNGAYTYTINLAVKNKQLDFEDKSPTNIPNYAAPGINTICLEDGSGTNCYCYVDEKIDDGLVTPSSNNVNKATVYWSAGTCPIPVNELDVICGKYSDYGYENENVVLQAHEPTHFGPDQSKELISMCGCGDVPTYCDPRKTSGAGSCSPSGDPLSGMATSSKSFTGDSTCTTFRSGGTLMYWGDTC